MKPQRQPNSASCLATAFAMVLDIPVEEIFKELGHDGTQIIFPGLVGARKYRCFHVQEMIDLCSERNLAVTKIEARPCREEGDKVWEQPIADVDARFMDYLRDTTGVLVGESVGRIHAVAWDGINILDPDGVVQNLNQFQISYYLKVDRILRLDS